MAQAPRKPQASKAENQEHIRALEGYFLVLREGAPAQVKVAKKELEKYRNGILGRVGGDVHAYLLGQLSAFDTPQEPYNKAAVFSGVGLFFVSLVDSAFKEVSAQVLKGIAHDDGRVREAARHSGDWLRMLGHLGTTNQRRYRDYISALEELIVRQREVFLARATPRRRAGARHGAPEYVEDFPSSPYKSVVMLWHQATRGRIDEPPDYARMKDLNIPRERRTDEMEEEVDIKVVADTLWDAHGAGDPEEARVHLDALYARARDDFFHEAHALGITQQECDNVAATVHVGGVHAGQSIMVDLVKKVLTRSPDSTIYETAPMVRALKALAENTVVNGSRNRPQSELLLQAVCERECAMARQPRNLVVFLQLIVSVHSALDEFFRQHLETSHSNLERLRSLGYQDEADELFRRNENDALIERSIAHHALEVLAQVDPRAIHNRTANKLAATVICAVKKINERLSGYSPGYTLEELARFGGWKNASGPSEKGEYMMRTLEREVSDPLLFLVKPHRGEI